MTYGELDERSSRLAQWLIGRGVGAEQVVVLMMMPRSVALAVAIWAVAKSGAAFVAVDPGIRRRAWSICWPTQVLGWR